MDGRGSGVRRVLLLALELHEDEVPDLQPAVALAGRPWHGRPAASSAQGMSSPWWKWISEQGRRARCRPWPRSCPCRRACGCARGARPASQSSASSSQGDALLAVEDGGREPVLGDGQRLRHELPGVGDRLGLEVVAEGEVAEHLEERVVARGEAHVLEVVVLAARAHALLRATWPACSRAAPGPVKTSLNCTMPALVKKGEGGVGGGSGEGARGGGEGSANRSGEGSPELGGGKEEGYGGVVCA